MLPSYLVKRVYRSNSTPQGWSYSLYTKEPLPETLTARLSQLGKNVRPSQWNFKVSSDELKKELQVMGISECHFESHLYLDSNLPSEAFSEFFQLRELNRNNKVLSEKYRKGLYRRTITVDGVITKEFSGGDLAKTFFSRGHKFLTEGPYRDRLVNCHADDHIGYYSYSFLRLPGNESIYTQIFNEAFDVNTLYQNYLFLVRTCWPFVHLDLHGDNIVFTDFTDPQSWYAIDFESFVKMPSEQAFRLYHGLVVQLVGHIDPELINEINFLSYNEFREFLGE